jgi:hypothetical protein
MKTLSKLGALTVIVTGTLYISVKVNTQKLITLLTLVVQKQIQ